MSWTYRERQTVPRDLHAVQRLRQLFAGCLGYTQPRTPPDYGLRIPGRPTDPERPYLVFLHATTWPSKHWPARYWAELTHLALAGGYRVFFPWHAPEERLQAERIMSAVQGGELLPRQDLPGWAAGQAFQCCASCLRG